MLAKESKVLRNVEAISFDLWQTLILENKQLGKSRSQLRIREINRVLEKDGHKFSESVLFNAYKGGASECSDIQSRGLDISFRDKVRIFVDRIEQGLWDNLSDSAKSDVTISYDQSFFKWPPPIQIDAKNVLGALRDAGYLLAIVSNTGMTSGITFREYLKKLGINEYFHTMIFSDEVGVAKPSTSIFELALKDMKVEASNVVHIGDDQKNDVAGAKLAGMQTIWIPASVGPNGEPDFYEVPPEPKPDIVIRELSEIIGAIV